jgi:hypothetical protein
MDQGSAHVPHKWGFGMAPPKTEALSRDCFKIGGDCFKIGVSGPTRRAGFRRDGHCE